MDGAAAFGQALREHRYARRLTQAELAERAGLSERAISDLERGLKAPQRATVRMLVDALALSPDAADAFESAARSRVPAHERLVEDLAQHNLPPVLTSFVGRGSEIAELRQVLDPVASADPPTHLVTLTGAGGCGKTRLAVELARRMLAAFPDGVWFADLSAIGNPDLVATAVLTAIGGREYSDLTPLQSLLRHVHGRRLLLVLDNCEHLVQACAEVVERLLGVSSGLRVLATSREALRVPGELAWRVPSLPIPDVGKPVEVDRLMEYAATKLFVDRIRYVEREFSLSGSNAAAAAQVCSRLDGVPLAIELAAGRAASMSVPEIAAGLDDCFRLLTGGARTGVARQRTLRATIDWSHALLSSVDRTLFRRLAVFAGGWTLDAAEAVCADDALPRSEILAVLTRLIDQSLVSVQAQDGRTRYRFFETVRAYAGEQLRAAGETSEAEGRHRAWCVAFAERANQGLTGPDQFRWFELVTLEHDNIRAVLDCCAREPNQVDSELRLVAAMGQFWWPLKPGEGRRRIAEALARGPSTPSPARTSALIWQAVFERNFGDPVIGRNLVFTALADARAVGDVDRTVRALRVSALLTSEDDQARRMAVLEEALATARAADLAGRVAGVLELLGAAAAEAGDVQRTHVLLDEGQRLARAASNPGIEREIDLQLGWLAIAEERLDDAESHFRKADAPSRWGSSPPPVVILALGHVYLLRSNLERAREVYRRGLLRVREAEPGGMTMADALLDTACAEAAAGFHDRAQRLIGANESWYAAHGGAGRVWRPFTRNPLKRGLVPIPSVPTERGLVQARTEGRAMTLDDAVEFALEATK